MASSDWGVGKASHKSLGSDVIVLLIKAVLSFECLECFLFRMFSDAWCYGCLPSELQQLSCITAEVAHSV